MLHRRLRKIGSILGLLAILMATLAPTVSQALQRNGRVDALLSVYCSADGTSEATAVPAARSPGSPASHPTTLSHLQACGYCNLFAHAPTLPSAEVAFAGTVWVLQHRRVRRFESLRRIAPLTSAQPRAPPFSS
ncbi:DUF2946 domain-containing protein [Paraburkholderia saeva]|uniref:DUF2946 domain-containing protein n=1 Tax=Paraburkholderia saeva TaxID=2777537 RepID=UPI001DD84C7A|nr:DUF2946 domain-containing protein [Paraburkholderia saeva]CAG4904449.1 hypothetical protein R70241_03208 [Paraburkholderia saeva]